MATVAARLPRERSISVKPAWIIVTLAVAAAGLYLAMRVPTAIEMQRALLRSCASLEMRPGDWPCEVTTASTITTFVPSSLLVGLGLALPCAVLLASGRRIAAFVPLLVPAAYVGGVALMNEVTDEAARADQSVLGIWQSTFSMGGPKETLWTSRPLLAATVDATLIAVPVIAGALFAWRADRSRGLARRRPPVGAASAWLSIGVVVTVIVMLTMFWNHVGSASEMSSYFSYDDRWVPMIVIASFGVLLGPDRRYSPWIFAPVALALSAAIPVALMGSVVHMSAFYAFGMVAPLVTVGLAGSAWRPLAEAFGRARARRSSVEGDAVEAGLIAAPAGHTDRPKVRRAVIANALASGLIAVSLIAARFDPLPVEISMPLPTFLGARQLVADVFVRTELSEGLAAMDAYYAGHGTYRGFDVRAATGVRWLDGSFADPERGFGGPNEGLEITVADSDSAQLVGLSQSGRMICARTEHTAGGHSVTTWGASGDVRPIASRLAEAIAACGARPLDATAFRTISIENLCPGVGEESLVMCRIAQRTLRDIRSGV